MTVVLRIGDSPAVKVSVRLSPLAELVACLHALTEADHHPAARRWRTALLDRIDEQLARDIARYAPLWSAYRSRVLYPWRQAPTAISRPNSTSWLPSRWRRSAG